MRQQHLRPSPLPAPPRRALHFEEEQPQGRPHVGEGPMVPGKASLGVSGKMFFLRHCWLLVCYMVLQPKLKISVMAPWSEAGFVPRSPLHSLQGLEALSDVDRSPPAVTMTREPQNDAEVESWRRGVRALPSFFAPSWHWHSTSSLTPATQTTFNNCASYLLTRWPIGWGISIQPAPHFLRNSARYTGCSTRSGLCQSSGGFTPQHSSTPVVSGIAGIHGP